MDPTDRMIEEVATVLHYEVEGSRFKWDEVREIDRERTRTLARRMLMVAEAVRSTMTDEMIEVAAAWLYEDDPDFLDWEEMTDLDRRKWRTKARGVLEAAEEAR